ncbi:MAG: prepilin-type N-terminal cleavage/methylation domain-containing protein [Phycisphaerales bacterium]
MRNPRQRGFTLVELLVVISIIALLVGILLPALGKARQTARQMQCSTHVKGLHQGLVAWANDYSERFPVPSEVDAANQTEEAMVNKNRTGNVLSLMIFQRVITPEICVSPAEVDAQIEVVDDGGINQSQFPGYEYNDPGDTVNPVAAIYDPQFAGSPFMGEDSVHSVLKPGFGNNSYAHIPVHTSGVRGQQWSAANSTALNPIIGNRGPVYSGACNPDPASDWPIATGALGEASATLEIHGGKTTWEGNIAYGDGHVKYEKRPDPKQLVIRCQNVQARDNLFVDDNQGLFDNRDNAYLRVWYDGIPQTASLSNAHLTPSGAYVWVDGR